MSELSDQEPAVINSHALRRRTAGVMHQVTCCSWSVPAQAPSCDNWASAFFRRHICHLSLVKGSYSCGSLLHISFCRNVRDPEGCFSLDSLSPLSSLSSKNIRPDLARRTLNLSASALRWAPSAAVVVLKSLTFSFVPSRGGIYIPPLKSDSLAAALTSRGGKNGAL